MLSQTTGQSRSGHTVKALSGGSTREGASLSFMPYARSMYAPGVLDRIVCSEVFPKLFNRDDPKEKCCLLTHKFLCNLKTS